MPKVTVVILSHRAHFLPGVLASVKAQTHPDVQIIVQHDVENWGTKFNEAASIAKGEWILPLCDDDLLDPRYLERCLDIAGNADIVYTDRYMFPDGTEPQTGHRDHLFGPAYGPEMSGDRGYFITDIPPEFFQMGATLPMTCLIRTTWWNALGGYDPQMPHADTEFWYRSSQAGAIMHYVPEPLFWYRQHDGQYSKTHPSMLDAMQAFHAKHFTKFGMLFQDAKHIDGPLYEVGFVPEEYRESVAEHLPVFAGRA